MSSFLVTDICGGEPIIPFIRNIFRSGKYFVSHANNAKKKKMQAGFNLMSVTAAHLNQSFYVSTDFRKLRMSWRKHSQNYNLK